MKISELREKNIQELKALIEVNLKELARLNIQKSMGNLKQVHLFKSFKKMNARILTLITQKQQEEEQVV